VTLAAISAGPAAADGDESGSAYAVRADALLLNATTATVPTQGEVSYRDGKGGSRVLLPVDTKPVKAHVLKTSSDKKGDKLISESDVSDVDLLEGVIKAKLIHADCVHDSSGVHGATKLVDAVAGGLKLNPDNPNSVNLANGTVEVRVNEQTTDAAGVLTVNGIHVLVKQPLGGASPVADIVGGDVVVSQARCAGNVRAAIPPSSEPAGQEGKLPNTGVALAWLVGGAAVLLGTGVGALWWVRRRRVASKG
jgi:LPXTG-motif cell wall-anchored protein